MLLAIIKRETIENVTSLRYLLSILLMIAVFATTGFVFVNKFQQERNDYSIKSNKNLSILSEQAKNLSHVANYNQSIYRKPKLTQLFCDGFEKNFPNTFKMNIYSILNPEVTGRTNFYFSRLADIDWVFIVSLIVSFVALLLTFDSFSSERERGTLSLVISNSIPRDKLLLGKYISAVLTLMIPLCIGLLINLIIVSVSGFAINGNQWLKLIVFIIISSLYLSFFLLLGMLVSSRCAKSSSSIVILMFIWVVLVIIVPACGRIVSEKLVNVPLRSEVDRRINDARLQILENSDRYGRHAGWFNTSNLHSKDLNLPAREKLYNAIISSRNRTNEDYINRIIEQVNLGRSITKISPVVLYQSVSEAVIGTGISRFRGLYEQLKKYRETLNDFIRSEDKKDPESWHLFIEGHSILLSQKPVDYNSIPKFSESDAFTSEVMKFAVRDIGILIVMNILLFSAAYVSFLRCDVRQR